MDISSSKPVKVEIGVGAGSEGEHDTIKNNTTIKGIFNWRTLYM
jgi:hypothetical protein